MSNFKSPLVLDLGSSEIKAGISTSSEYHIPDLVIRNSIGHWNGSFDLSSRNKYKPILIGNEINDFYHYDVTHPMKNGIIDDDRVSEEIDILRYIFEDQLNICPNEHPLFLCCPIQMGNNSIDTLYEIFFETFDFPMIQMQPQPLMSLYGHGLVTGIVVDSGKSHTDIVPVHDSKILYKNAFHSNFGGRDITQFIYISFLYNFGRNYAAEMEICKKIKEKMCFVSQDIKLERKIGNETTSYDNYYALEKGRKIKVSHQRCEAPEIMFTKQFDIERNSGIHKCIFDTIMKTDESLHDTFFKNIIISGNNTKFPGFGSRLQKEMKRMVSMTFLVTEDIIM